MDLRVGRDRLVLAAGPTGGGAAVLGVAGRGLLRLLQPGSPTTTSTDFLIVLLPVLLIGLAMIGFRMQMPLMDELAQAREKVAKLAANEERLRLARDMHDLTGQSLSMITLKSELAAKRLAGCRPRPNATRCSANSATSAGSAGRRCTTSGRRSAATAGRRWPIEVITGAERPRARPASGSTTTPS